MGLYFSSPRMTEIYKADLADLHDDKEETIACICSVLNSPRQVPILHAWKHSCSQLCYSMQSFAFTNWVPSPVCSSPPVEHQIINCSCWLREQLAPSKLSASIWVRGCVAVLWLLFAVIMPALRIQLSRGDNFQFTSGTSVFSWLPGAPNRFVSSAQLDKANKFWKGKVAGTIATARRRRWKRI